MVNTMPITTGLNAYAYLGMYIKTPALHFNLDAGAFRVAKCGVRKAQTAIQPQDIFGVI